MLELILLSLGLSCATGVLSLVASKARAASKTIACVGGMGAAALSFAGGIGALFQTGYLRQLDRAYALHELHALAESAGGPSHRGHRRAGLRGVALRAFLLR